MVIRTSLNNEELVGAESITQCALIIVERETILLETLICNDLSKIPETAGNMGKAWP